MEGWFRVMQKILVGNQQNMFPSDDVVYHYPVTSSVGITFPKFEGIKRWLIEKTCANLFITGRYYKTRDEYVGKAELGSSRQ